MATCKFKVGDMVIGNHPTKYGITKKGWIGEVTGITHNGKIRVFGDGISGDKVDFVVDPQYFDLYEATPATPAPDKYPRNCKVKLVAYKRDERYFTIGKVYEVKDNCIVNDRGHNYDYSRKAESVMEWLSNWYKFEVVEDDTKPIPTEVKVEVKAEVKVEVKVTIDIYANACFYCRKGGLVDRYLAGSLATCPACGRLCNSQGVPIPCSGEEEDDNEPLTTEELRQMDGQEVWCSSLHGGEERFVDKFEDHYCGWYVIDVAKEKLIQTKGGSNKYGLCANGDDWGFRAYKREPKHD